MAATLVSQILSIETHTATGQSTTFTPVAHSASGRRRKSCLALLTGGVGTLQFEIQDNAGDWYQFPTAHGATITLAATNKKAVPLEVPESTVAMRMSITAYTSGNITLEVVSLR